MRRRAVAFAVTFVLTAGTGAVHAVPVRAAASGSPELTERTRLPDRRSVVLGDRFYAVSTEDGLYPATGWHTLGEMGGFWTPPLKLLDGVWFGLDGSWLGGQAKAESFTAGQGYTRIGYDAGGVRVERTDVAPDGVRAGLIGLKLTSAKARTVRLDVDAHSELMTAYPWGSTTPDQQASNLPDTGAYADGSLVFREQGTPKVPNASAHDFAAMVAANRTPVAHQLGAAHRGPQDPPVICPSTGTTPQRCDDTAFGEGTGGRLSYDVKLPAGHGTTVWLAVAGSDHGTAEARTALGTALRDPARLLARKVAARRSVAANTVVDLPGDRLLQQSVEWSKQNLADSVQEARDLGLRATEEGKQYPPVKGTLAKARWIGAGWPDYPWIFGTDGEFTAFATVAAGQFDAIENHLRTLRDVSDVVNARSGKVVHEVVSDGSVYFGANDEKGNTDETAKYPSAAALVWRWTGDRSFLNDVYGFSVRNMHYVVDKLDADGDGWPEGLGNVERPGMGVEKLDNTVYTVRGLYDLADMARAKGDTATASWATTHADDLTSRFDAAWWNGGDTHQFADSLDDPDNPANDNTKIFQRHWIGLTPLDAELVRSGRLPHPLATDAHAREVLSQREKPCYTGANGLFHTGTGPTSAEGGNKVHHQHGHHGGRRGELRAAGAAEALHRRQRPPAARPGAVGDARGDAGDRAEPGLRPAEHRPQADGALDGPAGLGSVREPVAGRRPAARRRPGPGPRAPGGRPAGAAGSARGGGPQRPARPGSGGRVRGGVGEIAAHGGHLPGAGYEPAHRPGAAVGRQGHVGDP
jgi:hypothetical protein